MKRLVFILLVLIFMFNKNVKADQAYCLDKNQATEAMNLLQNYSELVLFCVLCGDKKAKLIKVNELKLINEFEGCLTVYLNGKGIDLAYTYFPIGNGKWKSVAKELKISVVGVPTIIEVKKDKYVIFIQNDNE